MLEKELGAVPPTPSDPMRCTGWEGVLTLLLVALSLDTAGQRWVISILMFYPLLVLKGRMGIWRFQGL